MNEIQVPLRLVRRLDFQTGYYTYDVQRKDSLILIEYGVAEYSWRTLTTHGTHEAAARHLKRLQDCDETFKVLYES